MTQPTIKELWENGEAAFTYMRGPGHPGSFYSMVEGNQYDWEADGSVLVIYESAMYSGGYFGIHVADGYEIDLRLNFNKQIVNWNIRQIEEYDAFWDSDEDDLIDSVDVQYSRPDWSTNRTLDLQMEGGDQIEIDIDDDYGGDGIDFGNFFFKINGYKYRLEEGLTENAAIDTDVRISLTSIEPNPIPPGSPGGPPATPEPDPDTDTDPESEPQPATHDPLGWPYDQAIKSWSGFGFSFEMWPYNKGYYIIEWKPQAANDDFDMWYSKRSPWGGVYPWISSQDAFDKADRKWADLQEKARTWYDVQEIVYDRTIQNGTVDNPGTIGAFYGGMFRVQIFKLNSGQYTLRVAWREFQEAHTEGIWGEWEDQFGYGPGTLQEMRDRLDDLLPILTNPILPDPVQEEEVEENQDEEDEKVDPIDDPIPICEVEPRMIINSSNTTNHSVSVAITRCNFKSTNTDPLLMGSFYKTYIVSTGEVIFDTMPTRDQYETLDDQYQAAIEAGQAWIDAWNLEYPPEVFTWRLSEWIDEVPGTAKWGLFAEYEETYDRITGRGQYQVYRYTIAGYELYFADEDRTLAETKYNELIAGIYTVDNPELYAMFALAIIGGIFWIAWRYRGSGGGV